MTSISPPAVQNRIPLVNVYVWEWPVRLTHWLNAISIWVLSVTGIYWIVGAVLFVGDALDSSEVLNGVLTKRDAKNIYSIASRIRYSF